jgi:hypothetical protein
VKIEGDGAGTTFVLDQQSDGQYVIPSPGLLRLPDSKKAIRLIVQHSYSVLFFCDAQC